MFLTVVTASRSSGISAGLTYETADDVLPGTAVRVPLRKKIVEGIVIAVMKEKLQTEFDLRSIQEVLGDRPLLTEAQMKTVRWMSEHYCCSLRHALQVWLPSPPWAKLLPPEQIEYRLAKKNLKLRGKKQMAVVEFLESREWASRDEVMQETGASAAILKKLLEQGVLEQRKQAPATRNSPFDSPSERLGRAGAQGRQPAKPMGKVLLTSAQQAAYESIKNDTRPSLLFGITGSGKTEVYAQLIADAVKAGKQALLLVPEILLTEHIIERFLTLLPRESISIIHSRLRPAERKVEWRKIHRGDVSLVIGSRSALFSPLQNLGLVILDEEHEWTYKNEQTPRYHARETAEELCRNAGAKLVLGTATPSLESWSRAKSGIYHLARLPERFGGNVLPSVTVIDLGQADFGKLYPFTPQLMTAIQNRLDRKEQCVLFLNRRGIASALLCLDCRRRVVSPDSLLPFTVHQNRDGSPYLMDHTTGLRVAVPGTCPHCKSARLHEVGAGTQGIEQMLKKLFPSARLLRADSDTLESPEQMRSLLQKMRSGQADILLGTQSVVKGLDLPQVTLAAVLLADVGMSLPHFRAGERIFQLLTQLTGRSGRAQPGEVIVQTFRPDALEILAAARHETERYLDDELKMRLHAKYPPANQIIRLLLRGPDAGAKAKRIQAELLGIAQRTGSDAVISFSPTLFGGGREWHILIRGSSPRAILAEVKLKGVVIDVDPVETV